MKKILSLLLALVMIVALFAGCAGSGSDKGSDKGSNKETAVDTTAAPKSPAEALVGTWEGELDLTEAMNEQMGEMMEGMEISDFAITLRFTFKDDGTYSMEMDRESVETAFEGLLEDMGEIMEEVMKAQAEEAGMTLEEMLAAAGMTMDDLDALIDEMLQIEDLVDEMVEGSKTEGKFEANEEKIFMTDDMDEDVDEEVYDTYTLEGDVLTLTGTYGSDVEGEEDLIKAVYPVVLKKIA